jgi:TIR domain-containing protein
MPARLSHQGVFISYRRQDTGPYARLLKEHWSGRLRGVPVFMDHDSIEVGVDFVKVIKSALKSCVVLVALIGPKWLTIADEDGYLRLDDPDDCTRYEIRTALKRCKRVIPVLVDGAGALKQRQLPKDLWKLARLNALEMSYTHYEDDLAHLTSAVKKVLEIGTNGM